MDQSLFLDKVRLMRIKQNQYLKDKKQSTLIEARVLEREVDKMIKDIYK